MKKYFLYELKKHLWTLVILTGVCVLPYVVHMATTMMFADYIQENGEMRRYIYSPEVSNVFTTLLILLFVVPIIMYSFKMSKRGVDGYYSLPLKKEKMYFALTMVGLILVLVPYTVAFWSGFFTLLFRPENPYAMGYFVPIYFGGLCFAIFLYGVNAFVFTRANRIADGAVLMAAYAFVGFLFINVLDYYSGYTAIDADVQTAFLFSGGMFAFVSEMETLICRSPLVGTDGFGWYFTVTILAGMICYGLLFYLLRYEKGENAEQNCESWFGYKTLIPVYLFLFIGLGALEESMGVILVLVTGVIATVIYRRSFRLKWKDFIPMATGIAVGILLMVMM